MTENQRRTKNLGYAAGTIAALVSHRIPSGLPSRFPGFSRCLLAPCTSCSLWVLLRIFRFLEFIENSAQQQPVRLRVFFSSLNFEFTFVHYTLSTTVCSCTLPIEQASPVRQILFCGAMVPTLLPVRPGPHLTNVGLLWVCHCHYHCHCQKMSWCGNLCYHMIRSSFRVTMTISKGSQSEMCRHIEDARHRRRPHEDPVSRHETKPSFRHVVINTSRHAACKTHTAQFCGPPLSASLSVSIESEARYAAGLYVRLQRA